MEIINQIEELRLALNILGKEKGFQDPQVIEISQKLDRLINEYYQIMMQEGRPGTNYQDVVIRLTKKFNQGLINEPVGDYNNPIGLNIKKYA